MVIVKNFHNSWSIYSIIYLGGHLHAFQKIYIKMPHINFLIFVKNTQKKSIEDEKTIRNICLLEVILQLQFEVELLLLWH